MYPFTHHIEHLDRFGWCHIENRLTIERFNEKTSRLEKYYFRNHLSYRIWGAIKVICYDILIARRRPRMDVPPNRDRQQVEQRGDETN